MTQAIDPIKLKAAAEHLEWVLRQYPNSEHVQRLRNELHALIQGAKGRGIGQPVDMDDVPGSRDFIEGLFIPYVDPNVDDAYNRFRTELSGGLSERDQEQIARFERLRGNGWLGIES